MENPLRRRILEHLVREAHYPLQLSRELRVSQQAIIKHLKVLEEFGMVESSEEASDLGGPPRRVYLSTRHFSLHIDLGSASLESGMQSLDDVAILPEFHELEARAQEARRLAEREEKLRRWGQMLRDINLEIAQVDGRRQSLLRVKNEILQAAREELNSESDYDERKITHIMMASGMRTPAEVAELLGLREDAIQEILQRRAGRGKKKK
ncbi:MAG TPA: helix-turn-helix domain-containing protein [Thermoplasmata archaeon]|nr:helix-turn-helix domain-containing protein [Thermoplasmata archaeon]